MLDFEDDNALQEEEEEEDFGLDEPSQEDGRHKKQAVRDDEDEDAAFDVDEEHRKQQKKKHRRSGDEEEGEDDEDDEEEDDDEDDGEARGKKRRKKANPVNRFLDLVADVDDDDEDDEEDEDYAKDDFLEDAGPEGEDLDSINRRAADHARLDRERELTDQDLARIAKDVAQRYRPTAQRYTGDMNEIPQRLLMPSVQDANLWQVRVKPGKERDLVFSLMRKSMDSEFSARPVQILSAFQRDSLPGMIYVEARSSQQVTQALAGLVGVFISRGVILVPIEEMASLLQIKKKETAIAPGSWVRIKRGKYTGDLAQVIDIAENGEEVGLKFVPRIDMNPKDDILTADGRKRKKMFGGLNGVTRPPQRLFNYEEVVKAHGHRAVGKRNQVYVFANDTFRDGYIEKDFKLSALILENVNPTLDEIMRFNRQEDGSGELPHGDQGVDLSIIAEASRKEAVSVLQPGDHVEVFEGEQTGVHGIVETISNDVVTLRAVGVDIDGQKVDVPARSVRKRFKPGDHVKVMSGHNADETGLVVSVHDNVVTFLSDMSMQEVSVFSKDLREAAEVGSSTNIVGNYELHDLVQLDSQTVGVIFKTERDSFRVLDQNGQVRLVQPHQIAMRRDSNRAIATDAEGHELRIQDNVKEIEGENRKGQVLHIHQSFYAFLFNREIAENGGVFVTRARSLASLAPKGNIPKPGVMDLSKMNPAIGGAAAAIGGMVGSQMGRGPKDRLIGVFVAVVKGPHKGYNGIIKDTNGSLVRVELQTNNKVISIDKEKLRRRNKVTNKLEPLEGAYGMPGQSMPPPTGLGIGGRTPNPYNQNGGRTPAYTGGRTPNPYADSRTPNPTRTPNPYGDGSRTPGWNVAAKTPNPYAQGHATPAWNTTARTPNPYSGAQDGSRTPSWNLGRTPSHNPSAASSWGANGGTSPQWSGAAQTQWNEDTTAPTPGGPWGAPTPAAASTPWDGDYASASSSSHPQDDGAFAETPAAFAETPGANFDFNDREDESFLLDPKLKGLTNLVLEIKGTNSFRSKWFDGAHEGKKGILVKPVYETSRGSTATLKLLVDMSDLVVPVEYLMPVEPDKPGDKVIAMEGTVKGSIWTVRNFNGDYVSIDSEGGNVDIHREKLVKYQEL